MHKYIVNGNFIGYEEIDLDENKDIKNSLVIFILNDKKIEIVKYYSAIKKFVRGNNKVIVIGTDKDDNFELLASLMVSMDRYDIYLVNEYSDITVNYLETCEEREPDYTEVQNFIGGDITAIDSIVDILFNIESMVYNEDIDTLNKFIRENERTISNMSTAFNRIRKYADIKNSDELVNKVIESSNKIKELEEYRNEKEEELRKITEEKELAYRKLDELKDKNKELKEDIGNLKSSIEDGSNVINCFEEINTNIIRCNVQRVLYFKEVSYVNYTASMINALIEVLKAVNIRVKLVIYDNSTSMFDYYIKQNMMIINTSNYSLNRSTVSGPNSFVLSEPSNTITSDLLTENNDFDVIIIYDKTHTYSNIVSGNIVTRLIVVNSSNEFKAYRDKLKYNRIEDIIITREGSSLMYDKETKEGNIIDIRTIQDYRKSTSSSKTSKYNRISTSNGEKLIKKIIDKSNISGLTK